MDRKSLIILVVAVLVLVSLSPLVDHFFPPKPVPFDYLSMTNSPPTNVAATTAVSNAPAAPAPPASSAPLVLPSAPEQTLTLTNEDLVFQFTSHGGGLKQIWLRKYPAVINRTGETALQTNMAALNSKGSSMFSVNEIKDLSSLVSRLGQQSDRVSAFLWSNELSELDQQALTNYLLSAPNPNQAQDAAIRIVQALNRAIGEPCIYNTNRFRGIPLRPDTIALLKQGPTGPDLAHLNHLLLEDAYPLEVMRNIAPAPVLSFLGTNVGGDNDFNLTQSGRVVTAEKTLPNGLRLVKEFDIGTNYLFTARVRLENTSAQPLIIPGREVVVGTATPIGPLDDPSALGTFWYNGIKAENIKQSWFDNRSIGWGILHFFGQAASQGMPRSVYDEGTNNVVWAAVHNQFFTLAVIPSNPAPRVMIHPVFIAPPEMVGLTNATSAYLTNGLEATCWYPATNLPPHQAVVGDYTFYAGPKEYKNLSRIGERMNNNLDLIMDFSGFTGFFSKMLLVSLNGLNAIGLGYGWAIIAITLIIKGIFWPLTRASTRSQKRMQALQPQMKAIADKYKDDPIKKNQKTMDFMKEHKVSPLGSCLPMMIQIPVFFGFYSMLRNAIELRGVPFLWAHDLSQPDTIAYLPLLGGIPINPLPLVMGATQLWQSHLLPPSPGMEPGQQKMMRYMPLLFVAMFYKMSSGLTLYWTLSNLLGILQTKVTRMTDDAAPKPVAVVPKKKM